MPFTSHLLIIAAVLAVVIILVFGLLNMARDGSANLSQKIMRWRVGMQFAAIVIIMVVLFIYGGN